MARRTLLADVTTTPATTADNTVTATIQGRLAERELLPRIWFVDTGYSTSEYLVTSETEHRCTLFGPIHEDYSWQARAKAGFAPGRFRA